MKRILTFACCVVFINATVFSQTDLYQNKNDSAEIILKSPSKFFFNVHTGYAIGLGSTFKFYPDDVTSIVVEQANNQTTSKDIKYKSTKKGLGEGFRYGGGLSYILNDFINLGFEFDYFKSTINRTRDSSLHNVSEPSSPKSEYFYYQRYTISYEATLLTFSPNITFKAISRPKFYIYNKVGAVITYRPNSIQKNINQESMHTTGQTASVDSASYTYTRYEWGIKKPALGFMASIGAQVKLSDKVRAFTEIQFSHIVFAVKNRVLTDYTVNGKNLVNTLSVSEKEIDFKNAYSTEQQNNDPSKPVISVVQRVPITYLGIQAGLAFRF